MLKRSTDGKLIDAVRFLIKGRLEGHSRFENDEILKNGFNLNNRYGVLYTREDSLR